MSLVVLTGASRGIGRAAALQLAQRGEKLALIGRPSVALEQTLKALAELDAVVTTYACDLADPAQIQAAADAVLSWGGAPDAVIHNAGVLKRGSVGELSVDAWNEQLAVNLSAPFLLTRALLPAMLASKRGRFVFVSSISATLGTANASGYNASKWGLTGFVKSLAEELSNTGLTAIAVLPGSVDTGMLQGTGFAPRMSADAVASTLLHYALDAPLAHNGAAIEMFGI